MYIPRWELPKWGLPLLSILYTHSWCVIGNNEPSMTQILMKAQSNAKVVLWSVLAICLMTAILSSSPQVAKAKSNKAEVTVTVENYRPDEKKVKYTVYKMGTHKVLGKKTFDFAAAEIEADEPTFTLVVKYNAKGLHEGNGIDVCVHRLAFEKGTYCYYGLAFHVGINPEAIIDISSDFGGGFDSIGTFEYYCTVHPFMTGKVVVK